MKTYKFNKVFYIVCLFMFILILFSVFLGIQIIRFYQRDGYIEQKSIQFLIIFLIVSLTWIYSSYQLLKQYIKIKAPISYDEQGVYDVLVGGILAAFIFILPVKFIPWEHLYISGIKIRIKKEYLKKYPFFLKAILAMKGAHLFAMYAKLDETFYKHIELPLDMKESEIA